MKVIKKINNNFALAIDGNGNEVIINGKGIGFKEPPYIVKDLKQINRTFYNVDLSYCKLLKEIDDKILNIASNIQQMAEMKLTCNLNPNLFFTLADHINFCISRNIKGISIKIPIMYDLRLNYHQEIEIGYKALEIIKKEYNIVLDESEAYGIALNIINSESYNGELNEINYVDIIDNTIEIIEKEINSKIDKNTFNYTRYATHLSYLIDRVKNKEQLSSNNIELFDQIKKQHSDNWKWTVKVCDYLNNRLNCQLNSEEQLYICLHINRLVSREDCNQ